MQDITSYINGYMKLKGNPYLRPSTDYTASLTYIFKGKYIANAYYSYVKDFFSQLPYQSPDELALVYQSINLDYQESVGLSLIIPFSVGNGGLPNVCSMDHITRMSATSITISP